MDGQTIWELAVYRLLIEEIRTMCEKHRCCSQPILDKIHEAVGE